MKLRFGNGRRKALMRERLRNARFLAGMTQRDVAEYLRIHERYY